MIEKSDWMDCCCSEGERTAAEGFFVVVSVDLAAGMLILDFL